MTCLHCEEYGQLFTLIPLRTRRVLDCISRPKCRRTCQEGCLDHRCLDFEKQLLHQGYEQCVLAEPKLKRRWSKFLRTHQLRSLSSKATFTTKIPLLTQLSNVTNKIKLAPLPDQQDALWTNYHSRFLIVRLATMIQPSSSGRSAVNLFLRTRLSFARYESSRSQGFDLGSS